MPMCETASIFSETIVMNAALSEVDNREKLSILESISQMHDSYSRYI